MNIQTIYESIIKQIVSSEEKMMIQVLTEFLGRVPVIDDFRKCSKIYQTQESDLNYYFAFEGTILGSVKYEFDTESFKSAITFHPKIEV